MLQLSDPLQSSHLPGNMVQGAVETGIAAGYRHIDTAFCYKNESEVGKALQAKIQQGIIKREDMFVVSKVRCCGERKSSLFSSFLTRNGSWKCQLCSLFLSDSCGVPIMPQRTSLCVWTSPWLPSSWTIWTFTSYISLSASRLSVCPTQCGTLNTSQNVCVMWWTLSLVI